MLHFGISKRIPCVGGVRQEFMNTQSLKKKDCVENIVKKYSDTVYKLAFARMRIKEDADDVFQEVFLNYIKNAPEFENDEHEKSWFIRVTLNCCKDVWRARQRCDSVSFDECEDVCDNTLSPDVSLENALAKIGDEERTLIHLYYYEGYKCNEIAKMLGKNAASVRMTLTRARRALKKYMEEDGFDA